MHGADDLVGRRGLRALAGVEELLVDLLARRRPISSIAMSTLGLEPDSRIMLRARSMICTGSPISSTNTSPPVTARPSG
jgi:hypothetical protein